MINLRTKTITNNCSGQGEKGELPESQTEKEAESWSPGKARMYPTLATKV